MLANYHMHLTDEVPEAGEATCVSPSAGEWAWSPCSGALWALGISVSTAALPRLPVLGGRTSLGSPHCPGPSPGSGGPRGWAGCSAACSHCAPSAPSSRWSPLWPGLATGSPGGPCTPAAVQGTEGKGRVQTHVCGRWTGFLRNPPQMKQSPSWTLWEAFRLTPGDQKMSRFYRAVCLPFLALGHQDFAIVSFPHCALQALWGQASCPVQCHILTIEQRSWHRAGVPLIFLDPTNKLQ